MIKLLSQPMLGISLADTESNAAFSGTITGSWLGKDKKTNKDYVYLTVKNSILGSITFKIHVDILKFMFKNCNENLKQFIPPKENTLGFFVGKELSFIGDFLHETQENVVKLEHSNGILLIQVDEDNYFKVYYKDTEYSIEIPEAFDKVNFLQKSKTTTWVPHNSKYGKLVASYKASILASMHLLNYTNSLVNKMPEDPAEVLIRLATTLFINNEKNY